MSPLPKASATSPLAAALSYAPEEEPGALATLDLSPDELGQEPLLPAPALHAPSEAPPYIADYFLEKEDSARQGFSFSFLAHGLLLVLAILKMAIFPQHSLTYIPSLRVDMVGLPDILKKDLKDIKDQKQIEDALKKADQEIAQKKAEEQKKSKTPKIKEDDLAKKDEMALKNAAQERQRKLKNALDRIKALNKISPAEQTSADPGKTAVVKGNMISKGTSLSAEARESMEVSFLETLRAKLHENWLLPTLLQRQNLSAQVRIFIDRNGRLVRYVFTKSSGNPRFDDEVKQAIENSQPFPPPPEHYYDSLRFQGVEFGFPL